MVQKVVFTKRADRALFNMIIFLEENVSFSSAQKLVSEVDAKIERLKEHPLIGRPSTKAKTVRKINVSKNIQLMYRVVGKTLVISNFFDTRQHPDKSRF